MPTLVILCGYSVAMLGFSRRANTKKLSKKAAARLWLYNRANNKGIVPIIETYPNTRRPHATFDFR